MLEPWLRGIFPVTFLLGALEPNYGFSRWWLKILYLPSWLFGLSTLTIHDVLGELSLVSIMIYIFSHTALLLTGISHLYTCYCHFDKFYRTGTMISFVVPWHWWRVPFPYFILIFIYKHIVEASLGHTSLTSHPQTWYAWSVCVKLRTAQRFR
jgi:hypothetical protein